MNVFPYYDRMNDSIPFSLLIDCLDGRIIRFGCNAYVGHVVNIGPHANMLRWLANALNVHYSVLSCKDVLGHVPECFVCGSVACG